jgi:sugar O-acyltransferase (sialic acid O-acetyltransferase NeuD family)
LSRIVLFGLGMMAEVVYHHITRDKSFEVVAFAIDRKWLDGADTSFADRLGLPVVAFEEVESRFSPAEHGMFVAMGYHDLNAMRAEKCAEAKAKGYSLVSYVSPRADTGPWAEIGENCLVLDSAGIQPGARLGDNVWLWNNSLVGHHTSVGSHCWLAAGTTIGGKAVIGERCFFGLGATVGGEIRIGDRSIVGAGALVTKDAADGSVFVERDTDLFRLDSRRFLSITRLATLGSREGRA